jgi:FkbM family methyltransferase
MLRFVMGSRKRNDWFKKNYPLFYTPLNNRLLLVENEDDHKFWVRVNWDDGVIISRKIESKVLSVFNPKKDDVILDLGANIGKYAILTGKKVGLQGKIIAVEPISETFQILQRNIQENNLGGIVIPLQAGISDKMGTARFYHRKGHSGASTMTAQISDHYEDIDLITVDEIVKQHDLPRLNWIKIDVEGFEYETLCGAQRSISLFKPIIIVEIREVNKEKVFDFFKKNNYTYEQLDEYVGEAFTGSFYNFMAKSR